MQHEHISEIEIDSWLRALGVTSLCQWDVLIFVYRHQTSLVGADFIAHLLGYAIGPVVDALDVLEFLGFVQRSRVSQIVRLYQFTVPSDPERGDAWARLLVLSSHRAGRVRLARHLRGGDQSAQAWLYGTQHIQASRQRLQPHSEGDDTWRKVI